MELCQMKKSIMMALYASKISEINITIDDIKKIVEFHNLTDENIFEKTRIRLQNNNVECARLISTALTSD